MKKRYIGVAMFLVAFILVFGLAGIASAQTINVQVDGQKVSFPDQQPFMDKATSRIFIPLRAVTESMGATVNWDEASQTVDVTRNEIHVEMTVGSTTPIVNEVIKQIDAPATMFNGRIMVPLRFISEAFGANVQWNGRTNTACTYLNTTPPPEVNIPGAPWEFIEVAKVIDFNSKDSNAEFVVNNSNSMWISYHSANSMFVFNINNFYDGKPDVDIQNSLQVFFPTKYQKVVDTMVYCQSLGDEVFIEKRFNLDGRKVYLNYCSVGFRIEVN